MKAYEVFYTQTQSTINRLYILVMCILPMLWFGDCKKTMSLLFKKIQLPNMEDEDEAAFEFPQNLQIVIVLLGILVYYIHRGWRLRRQDERCENLRREASFTETHELQELKMKLLDKINRVVEEKISLPLKCISTGIKPERKLCGYSYKNFNTQLMENIIEENRETENSSEYETEKTKKPKKRKPTSAAAAPAPAQLSNQSSPRNRGSFISVSAPKLR